MQISNSRNFYAELVFFKLTGLSEFRIESFLTRMVNACLFLSCWSSVCHLLAKDN